MSAPNLDAAQRYARRGWQVFPLHTPTARGCSCGKTKCSIGKHPYTSNGLKDATTDEVQIRKWWTQWPDANIGIRTGVESGLLVLDIDGDDGRASIAALECPDTVTAKTGKGQHYYFRHPGATLNGIPQSKAKLLPGVDVRGDGGYVVAPPSTHVSGASYEWEGLCSPDELALATPPLWLINLIIGTPDQKPTYLAAKLATTDLTTTEFESLRDALFSISAEDYDTYRTVGMALHSWNSEEPGFALWDEWSKTSRKYNPAEQRKKWSSFKGNGIRIATLYWHARKHGWIGQIPWPDPLPLDRQAAVSEAYPLDALPGTIGAAVQEYQSYGQQPIALVASSALAVVSLAAQGFCDVARDAGLICPLSLNFLILAQSGERKTAADKAMGSVLSDWERAQADLMCDDIKKNRAEREAWASEQEGLKVAIRSAMRKRPEEVDLLKQRLCDHATKQPRELTAPRLRYEDVNPQSLPYLMATGHPSAALWSDEGGMVTGSHGMGKDSLLGFMAGLNRMWDGGAIRQDRKQAASVCLEGRRLTVSLMVQPDVLRELSQRSGGLTRGSGFLARYLVAAPQSTMGERPYRSPPVGRPQLTSFHTRIQEMLDAPLLVDDQGRLALSPLQLSQAAFTTWRDYHDATERELKPLGEFVAVGDFAAKSAENAVRIAGCIHVFKGVQGAISQDTMQRAVRLARWYLREALRALDSLEEPQAWTDARLLDTWISIAGDCPKRDVLHRGPYALRDKARRDAAIAVLFDLGRVRIEQDGKRETLMRNPSLRFTATATAATIATDELAHEERVAKVATVAVAQAPDQEYESDEL